MWYGQDGLPYRIEDMETSHVVNVLAFLRRRADDLVRHEAWYEVSRAPLTEQRAILERWRTELGDDPTAWLNRQPLIKALQYELLLRDVVDGEVVNVRGELT
jgi:hypothetical protein